MVETGARAVAEAAHDALRLRFGKVNALLGDLHIRRMRQGALNQGVKLRIVIRLPPLALRPASGQRRR